MHTLLVEDDLLLGDAISVGLSEFGFTVDWLSDGLAAESALEASSYDLMVLDLSLPGQSGLTLLTRLRAKRNDLPVLILTARDTVADRVAGLDAGADDYLVKPFDFGELRARLTALARRRRGLARPLLIHSDLQIDPDARIVIRNGERIELRPKELLVLQLLLESRGTVVSRQRLEECLYARDQLISSNALEVHVHNLRKSLGTGFIRTVRGVGYMIEAVF